MNKNFLVIGLVVSSFFFLNTAWAQEISAKQVKQKTEDAVRFLLENGDAGLEAISDPAGEWARDPYVFVYDLDGTIIAHPNNNLIGKKFLGIKDVKGKMFSAEFVMVAKSDAGKGWVDYWWPKMKGDKPEQKVSYIMRVPGKNMLAGAGIYGYDAKSAEAEAGQ